MVKSVLANEHQTKPINGVCVCDVKPKSINLILRCESRAADINSSLRLLFEFASWVRPSFSTMADSPEKKDKASSVSLLSLVRTS